MKTFYWKFALPLVTFAPFVTFAQSTPAASASTPTGLANPLNATSLQGLVSEILGYAIQIGSIFLTIMLIYVGFQFVAARGNEEKLQSAKSALLWTVVGGLLLIGAQAIAIAIASTAAAL
jgi:hypothetical protein